MTLIDVTTDLGKRVRERLNSERLIWLTTQGKGGTPQPSLVWFLPEGDDVIVIYSRPDTPKLRNIAANPTVALAFNSDAHGGDVAVFHGEAHADPDAPGAEALPGYVEKYAEGIANINLTPETFTTTYSTPIRVRLTRLRGW